MYDPIDLRDVFVSYSSSDDTVAVDLVSRLEARNVSCWMAPRDVRPGTTYADALYYAIEAAPVFVVLMSTAANSSDHIARELEIANQMEKRIVPVRLEDFAATGAFFALSVADIDASGKWYSEKLGLGVIMQPQLRGPGAVMVLEGGGLIVALVQHDEALPLSRLTPDRSDAFKVHGHFKGGVIVKDLDKALALLKSRDVPIAFGPYAAKQGRRANFIIRDNAGNLIHFFGPA